MRFLDKLIALAVIVYLAGQVIGAWDPTAEYRPSRRAPPLPSAPKPERTEPAVPALPADLRLIVREEAALPDVGRGRVGEIEREGGPRRRGETSSGTAWPLADGVWVTARHVAEECSALRFRDTRWAEPRFAFRDASVDVMAFRTERREPALALGSRVPAREAVAVAVGYPKGKPAVAELRLIGTSRIRYEGGAPFLAYYWEVTRVPDALADRNLAGISGGPVIDGAGRTIGVAIFGNDRRGTLGTVALSDLRRNADPHAQGAAASVVQPSAAAALLSTRRVEQVICRR
ncbi:MAG: trypsin-like peptidase domain-containing protein [Alphaproteobacteria bacterium]|nr:trypsin-like peptidase domain-containing protein [Alphaproteobacteria bacterium]